MAYQFRTAIGKNIYEQKYSHDGQYTWPQLAEQLVKEVCENYLPKAEVEELVQLVTDMKFIPGGRYLYYAGRDLKAYNNCGTADTKLLTDKGWVRFGDVAGKEVNLLSPVDGEYKTATVHPHGRQMVYEYTFAPLRGKSNIEYKVRFTEDHKWLLKGGTTTENLQIGDVVPANEFSLDRDDVGFAHGFVFGDGNANGQLRLCCEKDVAHLERLSRVATSVNYPEFADGDPCLYFKEGNHGKWKQLPDSDASPEYVASFIMGWIAADGSKDRILCSVNEQALQWFREHAAYAGLVITGNLRYQDRDVKIGEYEYKNHRIYIQNWCRGGAWQGFKVVDKKYVGVHDVYCPFEPEYNQIVIDHNIRTFQCYLLRGEEDTREEWGNLLKRASDCLMTGGGIGIDYSIFRAKGSYLGRTGGQASGPIPLMHSVNEVGRNVMQGGSRRSAIYASLNWQHGDARDFLEMKNWHNMPVGNTKNEDGTQYTLWHAKQEDFNYPCPLDMTNVSLNYDDAWLFKKDRHLDPTFLRNCEQAMRTGEPGFSFNFGSKQNETLRNACVVYDTPLLTDRGYVSIGSVVGESVNVWNGREWSSVVPFSTGTNEIVRVHLTDGSHIDCTPYHKFLTISGFNNEKAIRVEAENLFPGMKLQKWEMPVYNHRITRDIPLDAYSQGFYSGDGNTDYEYSYLYEPKYSCEPWLIGTCVDDTTQGRKRWKHGKMLPKNFVPVNKDLTYKLLWFAGLLDSDGTVTSDKNGNGLQIASIDESFLQQVRLMLTTMGCRPKIVAANSAGWRQMPDGKGGKKEYFCQESKRLLIGNQDTYNLINLGLSCHRLKLHSNPPQRDARQYVRVKSVEWLGTEEETFCVTEPLLNQVTLNGTVTGNCTEVTSEDDSDVCNLGSVNMSRIETPDEFKKVVYLASRFLVCGTMTADLPYAKVGTVRAKNRRLGLGLMGIHEWLLKRKSGYEVTPELHQWLWIYKQYSEMGANDICDKIGINRPAAYRAIAPTGTIGMIAGTTTGIELLLAVAYKRRFLRGSKKWHYQYVIDGTAKTLIDECGVDPNSIDTAYGMSNDFEKRIRFQADIQDYVDMAISSTINIPSWGSKLNNEDKVKDFAAVLSKYAHRLRGFTVYPDGSRGGQPITECSYEEAISHGDHIFEENESCKGGVCGI